MVRRIQLPHLVRVSIIEGPGLPNFPALAFADNPGPNGRARRGTGPGLGVCWVGTLGEGGTTLRGGRNRRRWWISLGYVLGIAVVIVLIIWLFLVILPDPLGGITP